jgi:hypothetical protein
VDQMRSTKMLVKFDCYGIHDAYVNPLLWAALDHEQKRGVTMALSLNCVSIGEPQFVHVKDNMTGKEIAQFYGGEYRVF